MSRASGAEVVRQLQAAGALRYVKGAVDVEESSVRWETGLLMVVGLRRHPKFLEGGLHKLHRDVGDNLTDFRGFRKAFGNGALQIVVDLTTGECYADIDLWNPYEDAINFCGHSGEVIGGWWRKLTGRQSGQTTG